MPILFFEESASDKRLRKLLEKRNLTALDNAERYVLDEKILDHINTMSLKPKRRQELQEVLENNQDDEDYFNPDNVNF